MATPINDYTDCVDYRARVPHEVSIDFSDGSGESVLCEDWQQVRELLDEFKDLPARVFVDGEMVQQGFIAADDAKDQ